MSKRLRSHPHHHRRTSAAGFSLVELLIYVAMAGGVLATIMGVTVSQIRSTSTQELRLRTVDLWGRLSSLIESEISEAERIEANLPLPSSCIDPGDSGAPTTSIFSLTIPYVADTTGLSAGTLNKVNIYYYQRRLGLANDLWRCGPGYLPTGQLNYAGPMEPSLISKRTTMLPTVGTDNRSLSYQITMTTPKGEPINVHPSKDRDDDDDQQSNVIDDQVTTIRTRIQTAMP